MNLYSIFIIKPELYMMNVFYIVVQYFYSIRHDGNKLVTKKLVLFLCMEKTSIFTSKKNPLNIMSNIEKSSLNFFLTEYIEILSYNSLERKLLKSYHGFLNANVTLIQTFVVLPHMYNLAKRKPSNLGTGYRIKMLAKDFSSQGME